MRILALFLLFFAPLASKEVLKKTPETTAPEEASPQSPAQAPTQGTKTAKNNWATWTYASAALGVAVAGVIATAVDTGTAAHS